MEPKTLLTETERALIRKSIKNSALGLLRSGLRILKESISAQKQVNKPATGEKGKKASGMLMVKGTLYMWMRNANHDGQYAQLAWSRDHGKSWQFSQWQFPESFGCPTFLNFGKNYTNARDGYVYVYSQDETDAYKAADHMVMARVPVEKIGQLDAYACSRTTSSPRASAC